MKDICLNFTEDEKRKISIMNLQRMLNGMMEMARNRNLECVDVTSRQMEILMYLMFCKDENISQVDIERQFRMTNPTVTGILNRLEAKGFIVRKASELDKRVKHIRATERAWEFHGIMNEQRRQLDQIVFAGIEDGELEQLLQVLHKMCRNMASYLGKEDEDIFPFFHNGCHNHVHREQTKL